MAETEKNQQQKQPDTPKEADNNKKAGGMLNWIILGVIIVIGAGAGFGLGKLFGGPKTADANTATVEKPPEKIDELTAEADPKNTKEQAAKNWYFQLDPVMANLNEPGATRYIRVGLVLEISKEINQEKGKIFFDEKKPILTNWATIYLASITLQEATGDKNLRKIQARFLDEFNQLLFQDKKPLIEKILFKEFAIQ